MDKLNMHSPNKVEENIDKIGKLFPNCLIEHKMKMERWNMPVILIC
jgi:hypothetical protein